MMPIPTEPKPRDYRERLYQRYATEQMSVDIGQLKQSLSAGNPYYRRLVTKHMPADRNAAILDIGCGYGPLLLELKRAGYRNISGVDTSQEQIHVAKQLGLECVKQAEVLATLVDSADDSFDVLAAIDVIEHFTKD